MTHPDAFSARRPAARQGEPTASFSLVRLEVRGFVAGSAAEGLCPTGDRDGRQNRSAGRRGLHHAFLDGYRIELIEQG